LLHNIVLVQLIGKPCNPHVSGGGAGNLNP
jgi:hypothetical protein